MEKIKEFLKIDLGSGYGDGSGSVDGYGYGDGSVDGSGYGDGSGSVDGYGYGDGSVDGYGYGDGSGSGDGDGYGYGSGYGYGDGSGSGSGYDDGDVDGSGYGDGSGSGSGYDDGDVDGYGDGYGYGIQNLNGNEVYNIDGVETIINQLKGNVARGFILNNDLTLSPCVIVKSNNMFAHGENLHKAMESLQEKLFDGMTTEERIEAFLKEFDLIGKYSAQKFFEWHNKLTGSCEMGRLSFAKNNNIDLENDEFTVLEFIEKTKNDYGRNIIRELEKKVSNEKH